MEALHGHPQRAIARVDTTAVQLDAEGITGPALMTRLALLGTSIATGEPELARDRLERWDLDGLTGSPLLHSLSLALVAESYARAGRPAEAERLLARADSVAAGADFHQPGAVANARAVLALSRGDAQSALDEVEGAIAADFGLIRHGHRLTRALAYEALGRHREAAEDFERLTDSRGLFWLDIFQFPTLLPYAHERAGGAWLAAGDTARALQHLGAFTELWADADETLQPRVRAAATTIEALLRGRG
jgi:tetratricopeptide (TPR) repeat protein